MPLQKYKPTVAIEPAPVAPVGAPADLLKNKLEAFSNKMMQQHAFIQTALSKRRGEAAGQKLGFKPIKEFAPIDVVYNNAAMEAQKNVIQNQIRNGALGLRARSMQNLNTNSLNEYDNDFKSFSGTMLNNVSPEMRPFTENILNYYGTTNRFPVSTGVRDLTQNIARSNTQLTVNNNLQDAAKASFGGDESGAHSLYLLTKKTLKSKLDTGVITGSYYAHTLAGLDRTIRLKRYEGKFQRAINAGIGPKARAKFDKDNQKDLGPDEKFTLQTKFNRMLLEHKQDLVAQFGNVDKKAKNLENSILINGVNAGTQGQIDAMKSLVSQMHEDRPDKISEINSDLDSAVTRRNYQDSIKYANPVEINSQLTAAQAKMKEQVKANPEQATEIYKNFTLIKKDTEGMLKQRAADPYTVALQSPTVQAAMKQSRLATQGNVSVASGLPMGNATRGNVASVDNSMISVQRQMGIPKNKIMLISKPHLNALAAKVSNESGEESTADIDAILKEHHDNLNTAMANIQTVIKPANLMAYNIASNPNTLSRGRLAFQAMDNSTKDLEDISGLTKAKSAAIKTDVHNAINKNWGSSILNRNGDPTKLMKSAFDYSYNLALVYKQNGISGYAKQAVKDALDAHAQYGSYNGKQYQIPRPASNSPQYSTKDINDSTSALLLSIDPKHLVVPIDHLTQSPYRIDQKNYKNFLLTHAYPVTTDNSSGIQLLDDSKVVVKEFTKTDPNGRPADPTPIGFNFNDLSSNSSQISKFTAEFKRKRKGGFFERGLIGIL